MCYSDGQMLTIRLHGVDAREKPYVARATEATGQYVGGRRVRVSVEDIGRYGRTVASIRVQGGDLGEMLIRDGFAWYYEQYAPNETEYSRLER